MRLAPIRHLTLKSPHTRPPRSAGTAAQLQPRRAPVTVEISQVLHRAIIGLEPGPARRAPVPAPSCRRQGAGQLRQPRRAFWLKLLSDGDERILNLEGPRGQCFPIGVVPRAFAAMIEVNMAMWWKRRTAFIRHRGSAISFSTIPLTTTHQGLQVDLMPTHPCIEQFTQRRTLSHCT